MSMPGRYAHTATLEQRLAIAHTVDVAKFLLNPLGDDFSSLFRLVGHHASLFKTAIIFARARHVVSPLTYTSLVILTIVFYLHKIVILLLYRFVPCNLTILDSFLRSH